MKLYKAQELAEMLGLHEDTIYRLGREQKLETVKVGRSVRFINPAEIREVRNEHK